MVAQQQKVAEKLTSWAAAAGYDVSLETTFAGGKARLDTLPDLLVAEVKLAEYNGLHLALRAHAAGIPSIIIGPPDDVLAHEANAIGALYLHGAIDRGRVLEMIGQQLPMSIASVIARYAQWPVTTVAAEAEILWQAFSDAAWPQTASLSRSGLPN